MALVRKTLWFYVWMSLVFGALYLVAPELIMRPLGVEPTAPAGLTDLRATYGGFLSIPTTRFSQKHGPECQETQLGRPPAIGESKS